MIANARQISQLARLHRKRSTADDNAAVSHERCFSDDDVGTLRRRLDGRESEVFRFAFLADHFRLSDHFVWFSGDDAVDVVEHLSGWRSRQDLKTDQLRFAMCGSAPVPAEVLRRFEETFNCLVIEGYGLSESTCRSTFNPPDQRRRPGSCGVPIGNEMRVVDEEDHEVPDGELGEIVLRGENILKGYYKNDAANATAFRNGWFHTGDIGYRDADGFYFIVDRKSDMIIRGGENIYPREIDEVLYQHPAIAAAAAWACQMIFMAKRSRQWSC